MNKTNLSEAETELLLQITTFIMGWDFEYVSEACQAEADQLLDAVQKFIDPPCPRPFNTDPEGLTVSQCLKLGHCGCVHRVDHIADDGKMV